MLRYFRSKGFEEISINEYRTIYNMYGGSLFMDPDFIICLYEFNIKKIKFFALKRDGLYICAIPVCGNYIVGDRKFLKYSKLHNFVDFGRPSIIIPHKYNEDIKIQFKTSYLIKPSNITNAKPIRNRYLALFKDNSTQGITNRFKRDLRRYWKHFYKNNGTIKNISDYNAKDLSSIFRKLHFKRWGYLPPMNEHLELSFNILQKYLFGHILLIDNIPVSIQIIYTNKNHLYTNFEYINSGVDLEKSSNNINLGHLLIDLNTSNAEEISFQNNTNLIYSFGLHNVPYKDRWCKKYQLYKLGF